jgi:hypothetical protein
MTLGITLVVVSLVGFIVGMSLIAGGLSKTRDGTQANATVALLKPPFHYEFRWHPNGSSLQTVTALTFVPVGMIRPDTRRPVFYVKNLSKDTLRNVRVAWKLNEDDDSKRPLRSERIRKFSATIWQDPNGMPLLLAKTDGATIRDIGHYFQLSQVHNFEFVDTDGEVQVCPDRVYSAIEVLLLDRLAGAVMNTVAKASMTCQVEADGMEPALFEVVISGRSIRPLVVAGGVIQNNGDDAKALLNFEVKRL